VHKRELGATGIQVSALALGTWGLSGEGYGSVAESEQDAVIDRAVALGITLYETADSYAGGKMESRLGTRLPPGDKVAVATKIGTDHTAPLSKKRFDKSFLKESAKRSRERLKRERIDVLLLHNPSSETIVRGEATETLGELVEEGVARTWGISVATPTAATAALIRDTPVLEIPHNCFHTTELFMIQELIKDKNTAVLARSVLAYGLLCGGWPVSKEFPAEDHRSERWIGDDLRHRITQLNALRPSVLGNITSLRSVALRYVLANPKISCAVVGPRRTAQLLELVRDAGKEPPYMSEEAVSTLEMRIRNVGVRS
jgi:aryl-alcohol dehydrogenase-like predicted oxidoreductase